MGSWAWRDSIESRLVASSFNPGNKVEYCNSRVRASTSLGERSRLEFNGEVEEFESAFGESCDEFEYALLED
jgi:hypothetical protein